MTAAGITQIIVYAVVLLALGVPLGAYMARVYAGEARLAQRVIGPIERACYRLLGVRADQEQSWSQYAIAVLVFNLLGIVAVYALQRVQAHLPGNPDHLANVDPRVAFNTAISFGSNTNWQAYGGESTMSQLVQAAALGVQNFVSAATGMAVLVALTRAFVRRHADAIGSFWVDLTRSTLYILIPLSIVLAVVLVREGVPQTMEGRATAALLDAQPAAQPGAPPVTTQPIAIGPVASQVAIKQLGTNGGGYYNANSAHPLENPTPLANFLEDLAILLIPAALCFTFGRMVGSRPQGVALLVVMAILLVPFVGITLYAEQQPSPALGAELVQRALDPSRDATRGGVNAPGLPVQRGRERPLSIDAAPSELQPGGNMEGKEARFGISASALWAATTTAASNGSVNSMHDSYSPLGGLAPVFLMALGEVAFGGVGSGLYGLLIFAIVGVFIAGLMVGRTPELLGKKIEAFEMKMASLAILVPVAAVLLGTGLACLADETYASIANHGPHGFTEVLYAFVSQGNNNGSAFAGLTASGTFFATAGGICMWVARYWIIIPTLAIAGALAKKKRVPPSAGTLPTTGPLFIFLLVGVVILVGALSFVPALALGPIVEHLTLHS
ncbi:MAG TPA: potassium-transporting ATPase subunit KdpA [Kofleriaceae bacterium]|nr:potassium-transporting ATPase subunit KdpA [Kofleriaceae bacterium]